MSESRLGVALTKCFYCGKDDRIVLNTRLTEHCASKVEAVHGKVIDHEPCNECAALMKQGTLVIEGDEQCRYGGMWVLKPEAVKRIFDTDSPVIFLAPEVVDAIGLPRGTT